MAFSFRPATREQVGLLLGLAGPSGSGKTYSALRLASGMAGGQPFAVLDTEAGRAKHYADLFKFDHGDLTPPFSPDRYLEAIQAAELAGYPVIVVDSMSHEWAGDGGCCEMQEAELDRMAGTDWKKREAVKIAAWIKPKIAHKKLVSRLLQCRAHLLFCFRAEPKIEMQRGPDGKLQVVPKRVLGWASEWIPVTEKNFLFEMTASFVLSPDKPGVPVPIKLQEQHRAFFSLDAPINESAGVALAAWAKGGLSAKPVDSGFHPPPSAPSAATSGPPASGGPGGAPSEAEILANDYRERFDEVKTAAEGKGWSERWEQVKATVPPELQKLVEDARNRARARLRRPA